MAYWKYKRNRQSQYWFMKGKVMGFFEVATNKIDKSELVNTMHLDFHRGFDTVKHKRLPLFKE